MAPTNIRTPRPAVEHFRATGRHEEADVLARLLDRPRTPSRLDRRRELFTPDVVDFLEAQDRRRDAARRLPPICPFSSHEHTLGCHDPIAATG
jgi:hypothetical protein